MGFQFVVMFIESFMDDVTYVWDVEVPGPLHDQTVAHSKSNYCFLSLAEQNMQKQAVYSIPLPPPGPG
jgi:hypothetical protein